MAISTFNGKRRAYELDMSGGHKRLKFTFRSKTEIDSSCSVLFRGQVYIYGGWIEKNQISQVSGCSVKRIGTLPFIFFSGACTSIRSKYIMLCFDLWQEEGKVCRMSQNPTGLFTKTTESNTYHFSTNIVSNGGKHFTKTCSNP